MPTADATGVRSAYRSVCERIAGACARAGRDPSGVRLVAVTKTFPPERIRELLVCGHGLIGENRVQEALAKMEALGPGPIWHLVGHLQTNKARQAVGRFELIHGVDSERLGREIERRAAGAGLRQALLIQANLSREPTKFGVAEDRVLPLLELLTGLEHVDVRGLMTIPPPVEQAELSRPWFAGLRRLRDRCAERLGRPLPELSMGMTDDFEVAVEEGATLVRIGRALFGER